MHFSLRYLAAVASVAVLLAAPRASAQTAPNLGAAQSFAVLSGTASVSSTGSTVVNGDLGTSGAAGISGFGGAPPSNGLVNGNTHNADVLAGQAQTAAITGGASALVNLQGQGFTTDFGVPNKDLSGLNLTAGVFKFGTTAQITTISGALTLSGGPNDVFIFQVGTALNAEVGSTILLSGGVQSCNVFWAIGTDATIKVGATFVGNILSTRDIVLQTNAHVFGRTLAGRAITMDTNTVDATVCAGVSGVPCVPGGQTPTITAIPSQVIPVVPVGGSVAVGFTIGGPIITDALVVRAISSNTTLVAQSSMTITKGIGGARVLTIFGADGRTGVTSITVTVTDPTVTSCSSSASVTFLLTVGPTAVPTLPEGALLLLAVLLTAGGVVVLRMRRRPVD